MAQFDLKKFRHGIAVLKKKKLVSGVDARSVKPTPALKRLVNKLDDVISDKATPVKLTRSETANLKAAGYEVYKGKILYPHSKGEKITVTKDGKFKGHVTKRSPNGVERVTIPVKYENLKQYLGDLQNDPVIDDMKKKDEYFAFRFHGHNSTTISRNIELLLEEFERYEAVQNAINSNSAKDMMEVYRNLEIVKVHRSKDWKSNTEKRKAERNAQRDFKYEYQREVRKAKQEGQYAAFKAHNATKQQRHRDSLTPAELKKYKAAAKKRAKKSRENHAVQTKKGNKKKARRTRSRN